MIIKERISEIIKEEVSFYLTEKYLHNKGNSFYIISEGKAIKSDFNKMIKMLNERKISSTRAFYLFESSLNYEQNQLLNEGIFDILKKTKDWAVGKAKQAWDKLQDWMIEKSVQLLQLAQSGAQAAMKSLSKLGKVFGKMNSLCKANPVACKVVIITMTTITAFVVFSIFANNAEAAAKVGKEILDEKTINGVKGLLNSHLDTMPIRQAHEAGEIYAEIIAWLDKAHQAKEVHEITEMSKDAQKFVQVAVKSLDKVAKSDPEMYSKFVQLGHKISAFFVKTSHSVIAKIRIAKGA